MVGNGCTNWDVDTTPSLPETLANMQLIPPSMLKAYQEGNCVNYPYDKWKTTGDDTEACDKWFGQMQDLIQDLNIYDLFRWYIPDPD